MWLFALGFGIPTAFVAVHLLRERTLPIFMGLFPMYGGGFFQRWSPEVFVALLGLFAAVSAIEAFAGVLLWQGEPLGAFIRLSQAVTRSWVTAGGSPVTLYGRSGAQTCRP